MEKLKKKKKKSKKPKVIYITDVGKEYMYTLQGKRFGKDMARIKG